LLLRAPRRFSCSHKQVARTDVWKAGSGILWIRPGSAQLLMLIAKCPKFPHRQRLAAMWGRLPTCRRLVIGAPLARETPSSTAVPACRYAGLAAMWGRLPTCRRLVIGAPLARETPSSTVVAACRYAGLAAMRGRLPTCRRLVIGAPLAAAARRYAGQDSIPWRAATVYSCHPARFRQAAPLSRRPMPSKLVAVHGRRCSEP